MERKGRQVRKERDIQTRRTEFFFTRQSNTPTDRHDRRKVLRITQQQLLRQKLFTPCFQLKNIFFIYKIAFLLRSELKIDTLPVSAGQTSSLRSFTLNKLIA